MQNFKPETLKALDAGRCFELFFFDFSFFPTRVHAGDRPIEWEGETWKGIGDVAKVNFNWDRTAIHSSFSSRFKSSRGHLSASLPLDKQTSEVVAKDYYRGRKLTMLMCSFDEYGKIIERFGIVSATMLECSMNENNVATFTAVDDSLDSPAEKDARHAKMVELARQRFGWELSELVATGSAGWVLNTVGAFLGSSAGLALDCVLFFLPTRRRSIMHRWNARKRLYWLQTHTPIPGLLFRKGPKGYWFRADTLDDAILELWRIVVRRIWEFDEGDMRVIVTPEKGPPRLLDLDVIRRGLKPEWNRDELIRQWLDGGTGR